MLEAEYRLVDTSDCIASDAEPAEPSPERHLLLENLKSRGQTTPVLLAPHPTEAGMYQYIDGHGRGWCLAQIGLMMKALVFPRPLTPAELIEYKFANNLIRRSLSMEEVGLECSHYLALTGGTQKEVAARLAISTATISRCMTRMKRIPTGCEAMAKGLGPSLVALALSLKTPEHRRLAFEFASMPQVDGKRPNRAELSEYVDRLKGGKPAKPARGKRLRFLVEGREFLVESRPGDTAETLIEAFRAAANQIAKHRELKAKTVAAVLADRDSSG